MEHVLFAVFLAIFVATATITLLALIGKVTIKDKYLKVLVAAFLLELATPVVALFSNADFFRPSAADFIKELPSKVLSDSPDVVRQKIQSLVDERNEHRTELSDLREQLRRVSDEMKLYEGFKDSPFLLFAQLSSDIGRDGQSINLTYKPREKQEEATRICDALTVVFGERGCKDSNPTSVAARLRVYQEAWQFESAMGYFGQQTLIAIINEYLLRARFS